METSFVNDLTNPIIWAMTNLNKNAVNLKLKAENKKGFVSLSYEFSVAANDKVFKSCSFDHFDPASMHRIYIERSQDGKSYYSLQMFGSQFIPEGFHFIDESSDWYDKLWYRLRAVKADGTKVLSQALVLEKNIG